MIGDDLLVIHNILWKPVNNYSLPFTNTVQSVITSPPELCTSFPQPVNYSTYLHFIAAFGMMKLNLIIFVWGAARLRNTHRTCSG